MAELQFFTGTMDSGKSTLALQTNHNHAVRGRVGRIFTTHDRAGESILSSRLGLQHDAIEVRAGFDFWRYVVDTLTQGGRIDYLICDEAQFYSVAQVEQMADLVDRSSVDVYAFGLATDFRSELFPGTKRLFELADELLRLQVEVLCWCGRPGQMNARVAGGAVVREGDQVVVADTDHDELEVRYQVLCRHHYREGDLGPAAVGAGQLRLPDRA